MIVVDQHRAELDSIEQRLKEARFSATQVERILLDAGLETREKEYVRLRYFENRSAEAVAQRMFCSTATCRRIRKSALDKVAARLQQRNNEAAHEKCI